jgi:hypothetical protein
VACNNCEVAPGKQKYCRKCAKKAAAITRRKRRERLKAQGVPVWQRNGWTSVEQFQQYYRDYMRGRRKHEQSSSTELLLAEVER